jgi:hypothetical protein
LIVWTTLIIRTTLIALTNNFRNEYIKIKLKICELLIVRSLLASKWFFEENTVFKNVKSSKIAKNFSQMRKNQNGTKNLKKLIFEKKN